jgi:hypothetical protein
LGKDDSRYWPHASADGLRAENPQQALAINFTPLGAELESHQLRWGLETRGYGYGDAVLPLSATVPLANDNRVEYRRGGLTEWYENGPMGLEQGFILAEPPGKPRTGRNQPLTLALTISGDLVATLEPAELDQKSTGLTLTRKDGQAALRYTGLNARDATGRELQSWLELSGKRLLLWVEDGGANYPVAVDPWIQQAKLTASDGATHDFFGWTVAVSGSTAVIGSPGPGFTTTTYAGAVYVFAKSGGIWSQQAELTASDAAASERFGWSVAVDENTSTVVVGAPNHTVGSHHGRGAAYVFVKSGGTWKQQAELTASDGAAGNHFGISVAVSGSTIVVGSPSQRVGSNLAQGAAYVFVKSGGTWKQQAELTSSDGAANDHFGTSVAVDESTAALVGAHHHTVGSNASQGAAYAFVNSGGTWSQQAELTSSDGAADNYFGCSVAISGSTAVVGSPGPDFAGNPCGGTSTIRTYAGAAYVFVLSGTTWSQQAELTASDGAPEDNFGISVAVDESTSTTVVGALNHKFAPIAGQGAAYVFVKSGAMWSQQAEVTTADGVANENLGESVALSGSTAVAGVPWYKVETSQLGLGAAYVFVPGAITVTLSPLSLSLGNEALKNTSAAKSVRLTNTSTGLMNITSIATNGDFAISSSTCGTILAAGRTCKVNITFTPTQLGARAGTLTFSDAASNSPQTVTLSGTGVVDATLTPASENYGKVTGGTTSTPKTLTLANNQNVPLSAIVISTTGDFTVSSTTCTTTLGAKDKCSIALTFTPTQTGARTGALSVSDSGNNSPQTSSLTGIGK